MNSKEQPWNWPEPLQVPAQTLCDWPELDWQQGLPPRRLSPSQTSCSCGSSWFGGSCLGGCRAGRLCSRSRSAALCAAAFLLLRVFLVAAGSLAVVLADSVGGCQPSCSSCWFFSPPFCCWLELSVAGRIGGAGFRFLALRRFFLGVVVEAEVSAAADSSADALASFFVFFFFFLLVVVEAWSSVELAWGLAMAEIPLSTKNMQSAMVHILSLVCSLFMISSLVPDRSQGTAEACLRGAEALPDRPQRATIMTLRPPGVNQGFPGNCGAGALARALN